MDLSAASLAYAERRLATCHQRRMLPHDSPRRVTFVVGDIALLPAPAAAAAAADATARTSATLDATPDAALPVAPTAALTAATLLGERFHLVCCVGVLHHIPNHAAALRVLAEGALLPGGLLQLATYTKLGVDTWRHTHHTPHTACACACAWAPHVHRMCTACAPHVHRMCTACAAVYCVCITYRLDAHSARVYSQARRARAAAQAAA